jgi:tRNA (guanine37-N1)-methyltransferase
VRIDVVTLFPDFVDAASRFGVVGRARTRGLLDVAGWNPRDYAGDPHRTVDDRPYGGGPGMVMLIEPLRAAIAAARAAAEGPARVVHLSPQGERLSQSGVRRLAALPRLILVCGRYEALDERLLAAEVDEELSIGDYVLSGGELPACVLIDAVGRLLDGALGDAGSAQQDSFGDGLLDCGHWTRPEQHELGTVPPMLMSGDHAAIARWRRQQSLGRTWLRRPDLLARVELGASDRRLLAAFIAEHRAATLAQRPD